MRVHEINLKFLINKSNQTDFLNLNKEIQWEGKEISRETIKCYRVNKYERSIFNLFITYR